MSTNESEELGIYFKCFFGANAHFGLTEDDSFSVEDNEGRTWICHPIKRKDVEALDLFIDFPAIEAADERIGEETQVRILFCKTKYELPSKLVEPVRDED